MTRIQQTSTHSSQPHGRRNAAWALAGMATIAATLALWRAQPGEQRAESLAVSVPAASSPAADAGPGTERS